MATQMPTQGPTRVGARGARRSTDQLIQEVLPQTSTAAISNDLLAQLVRQRQMQPQMQRQQQQRQQQVQRPNAATILGSQLRSLTRMGPQGTAELQALLTYGPQSDRARRLKADGSDEDSSRDQGQGQFGNRVTQGIPGKETPGWAKGLGKMGLGTIFGMMGPAGVIPGLVMANLQNDEAATFADIGTRALSAMLPESVRTLLNVLKIAKIDPVKDLVKDPLAAELRKQAVKQPEPVLDLQPELQPAQPMAPAVDPELERQAELWRMYGSAGRRFGGEAPNRDGTFSGAVSSPVRDSDIQGTPLGPVDGNYGGAGWGGEGSRGSRGDSGGGGMNNTGEGGPGSVGGW